MNSFIPKFLVECKISLTAAFQVAGEVQCVPDSTHLLHQLLSKTTTLERWVHGYTIYMQMLRPIPIVRFLVFFPGNFSLYRDSIFVVDEQTDENTRGKPHIPVEITSQFTPYFQWYFLVFCLSVHPICPRNSLMLQSLVVIL